MWKIYSYDMNTDNLQREKLKNEAGPVLFADIFHFHSPPRTTATIASEIR
jgi:hypothetical protein